LRPSAHCRAHCTVVDQVAEGLWHVVARFGFFEIPDLRRALRDAAVSTRGRFDKAVRGTRDLIVQKPKGASLKAGA